MTEIEPEHPLDLPDIEALLDRAFGADRHAKRSYSFRTQLAPIVDLCLVAREEGHIVGTIRYWPILIGATPALLLGPVAVDDPHRRSGLGGNLIRQSLRMARDSGHRLVVLVGDHVYYSRFGFAHAHPTGIAMPGEDPARVQYLDLGIHADYAVTSAAALPLELGDGIIRRQEEAQLGGLDLSRRIYAAA
ncbi:MAG TPA: N-acetyltransferase [Stellaceae bacterium]|jgi:predicted N-acetyltransferase YhbS|nr:N-acetyltransferase [Stellaceae bacterium]